jgi:small subunit ribosomal protein S14
MAKISKVNQSNRQIAQRKQYLLSGVRKENRISTRGKLRCKITGRPRAYMRYFGLSRLTFRELANKGELPGVVKASR